MEVKVDAVCDSKLTGTYTYKGKRWDIISLDEFFADKPEKDLPTLIKMDIDGFLELAKEIQASVYLSSDMNVTDVALPEATYQCALRLGQGAIREKISFTVVAEFFNSESYTKLIKNLYE